MQENVRILAFLAVYFVVTSVTIYTTRFSGGLALVWLGSGILVGLLVHLPYRRWPRATAYFVAGSACATTLFGFGFAPAIPLAIVNVFEAAVIAALMRRVRPQRDFLEDYYAFAWMALCAAIVGPVVAGSLGAAVVHLFVTGSWAWSYGQWIAGHGLGTAMMTPLALLISRGSLSRLARKTGRRGYASLFLLAVVTVAVTAVSLMQSDYPTMFLPVIPLLAACFLLGWVGAMTGLLCIAVTAVLALTMGVGQIAQIHGGIAAQVLYLQFYVGVMMLIALPIATVLSRNRILMAKITKRDALHRLICDHSEDAMLTVDLDGRIRYASAAAYQLSGEEKLVGRDLSDLAVVRRPARLRRSFVRAALRPGETQIQEHKIGYDEDSTYIETMIRAYEDTAGTLGGFVVSARDITRRRLRDTVVSETEQTDPLTGLPNRRRFFKHLKAALSAANQRSFVIALFDLDSFEKVNQRYGRDIGDLILKHVGKTMRIAMTRDLVFARIAGEEFALIATGDPQRALAACEQVVNAIESRDALGARSTGPEVTVSVGLVTIEGTETAARVMRRADDALIAAKTKRGSPIQLVA